MTTGLATKADPELVDAFARLIPQLSTSANPPDMDQLEDLLSQEGVFLFTYRNPQEKPGAGEHADPNPILGLLTLVTFQIPTGKRAWIEDVVVDAEARGHGAGQALVEAALAKAAELGCVSVDLTSRPSREAANRLYVRCGFKPRETNIYRYTE